MDLRNFCQYRPTEQNFHQYQRGLNGTFMRLSALVSDFSQDKQTALVTTTDAHIVVQIRDF